MEHIERIWPSFAALASDMGLPYQTVAAWRQRDSIPARYDLDIIEAASRRGHVITLEQLAQMRRAGLRRQHLQSPSAASPENAGGI